MTPADVLTYWFGNKTIIFHHIEERNALWFHAHPKTDAEIKEKFSDLLIEVKNGQHEDWLDTPQGRLAYIIVLDQFSRVVYRGQPEAFATDEHCMQVVQVGLSKEHDLALTPIERVFFYMPFQHTENATFQKQGLPLFQSLVNDACDESQKVYFDEYAAYAHRHAIVIDQFGRFPHRNALLGRNTTPDELRHLEKFPNGF